MPYLLLGGFSPLHSDTPSGIAAHLGATPMQVALAWLLRRAPNILPTLAPRPWRTCGRTSLAPGCNWRQSLAGRWW